MAEHAVGNLNRFSHSPAPQLKNDESMGIEGGLLLLLLRDQSHPPAIPAAGLCN